MAPTTDVRAGLMSGGVLDWQVQDGDWDDCVSLDKAQRELFWLLKLPLLI